MVSSPPGPDHFPSFVSKFLENRLGQRFRYRRAKVLRERRTSCRRPSRSKFGARFGRAHLDPLETREPW
jgi:hypothetical protein